MTEIQKLIIDLHEKVKTRTSMLDKLKQEVASLESLIFNDSNNLRKIVEEMGKNESN